MNGPCVRHESGRYSVGIDITLDEPHIPQLVVIDRGAVYGWNLDRKQVEHLHRQFDKLMEAYRQKDRAASIRLECERKWAAADGLEDTNEFGQNVCHRGRPYTKERTTAGQWVHPGAVEIHDGGDYSRYECAVCGHQFRVELPQ